MKKPTRAKLLLDRNVIYPIQNIHFDTQQVTLKEGDNVYNTVSFSCVEFDFTDFNNFDLKIFELAIK